jgi:FkbM family methyltransferase
MIHYLNKKISELIESLEKNGITETIGNIPSAIWTDLNIFPTIIRTNVSREKEPYKFNDRNFKWYLPDKNYHKFLTCKNWNSNHDRYQEYLTNGDCLLKVGAATGEDLPLAAEKICEEGHIYAFEPNPKNFECLNKNLDLYNINSATTEMVAVSSSANEEVTFLEHKNSHTTHRMLARSNKHSSENFSQTTVSTTTVDDIYSKYNIKRLKMLSITVNGHEEAVLEGATETLKHTQYVVIPVKQEGKGARLLEDAGFQLVEEANSGTGCLYENAKLRNYD